MKIIIVGIGKLGENLAKSLVEDGNEITLIDNTFDKVQNTINNEDLNYICGNGLDSNVLLEAGITETDILISVMDRDEQNFMCSFLGKKLGAKRTIARIRTPEYTNSLNMLKEDLGLTMVINPERLAANHISRILNFPSALDVFTFFKGRLQMISLKVKEDSKLCGMSIVNLSKKVKGNIIACAIEHENEIVIPHGETIIKANDKLNITGTPKDLNEFLRFSKLITSKTKKVIISGGSNIAIYLAKNLLEMGMEVKIIEIDEERCKMLSETLPKALIIKGDVSNQNVLYEEEIDKSDAFIALNSIDEENIIYSMFASMLNVPKIITKVNHINLDKIIEKANIDTVITPHKIAINQIVKYVRAIHNSEASRCEAIYRFDNNQFEMLEFNIKNDFEKINTKIKDMRLKKDVIIVAILRGKNIIYPNGNDEIQIKDTIIVANKASEIIDINDILE